MRSSSRLTLAGLVAGIVLALLWHAWPGSSAAASASVVRWTDSTQAHAVWLQALAPPARLQFGQRVAAWRALPRVEREDRRARFLAWRQLPESERIRLRVTAAQIAAFAPERQQALRSQFQMLEDSQRRGWRLGPALGADYEKLHPLLAYVDPVQRLPLLSVLQSMEAEQRADLAVLVQRTPPQERASLRDELVRQPPARRGAWLRDRLAH
ncbi:MAG: DUF3106 domain-containing protein [Lysobacteraceae bacterium]|nr:MAG: DUF3106 domain-containing protein [Xanthomonadaceae bacterium]